MNIVSPNEPNVTALLDKYALPSPLGFGQELAPIMYRADYMNGTWQAGHIIPFGEVGINPAATCVQFGQQCFEGMKAYKVGQEQPSLFRPEANYARFRRSATRLNMPPPTPEIFADAISQLTSAFRDFIPGETGQSLYLRPTLLGLDHTFAVTSSKRFCFLLLASPSDAYYSDPIKVMIERTHSRAARGGTGAEKVGGNYAGSLLATERSIETGFDQPLWLDAASQTNVEELSGMNIMAVVGGELHTPALSGTILPGVTRDSLLQIAQNMSIKVVERTMPIADLIEDIKTGACTELFASGTAAIVCPISHIGEAQGDKIALQDTGNLASKLRDTLLGIQEGRAEDPFDWTIAANDESQLLARLK